MAQLTKQDSYEDLVTGQTQAMEEYSRVLEGDAVQNGGTETDAATAKEDSLADFTTRRTQDTEAYASGNVAAPASPVVLVPDSHPQPQSGEDRPPEETEESQSGEGAGFGQEDVVGFGQEDVEGASDDDDSEAPTQSHYSVPCAQPARRYESSLCSKDVLPYFPIPSRTGTMLTVDDDGVETRLGRQIQEFGEEVQLLRDRVQKAEDAQNELREELEAERTARKVSDSRVDALERRLDDLFKHQQGKKRRRGSDDEPENPQTSRSVKLRR